jgi:hypothetical protein
MKMGARTLRPNKFIVLYDGCDDAACNKIKVFDVKGWSINTKKVFHLKKESIIRLKYSKYEVEVITQKKY